MVTYQVCPQTPGGRIRALGFARMGARRRSPPIPMARIIGPLVLGAITAVRLEERAKCPPSQERPRLPPRSHAISA